MGEQMTEFYWVTAFLIALAALFVIFPVMQRHGEKTSRRSINIEAFRERRRELDAELAGGAIDRQEYDLLCREMERRLLDEADTEDSSRGASPRTTSPLVTAILVIFLAALAVLFYEKTGARPDWEIAITLETARKKVTAGEDATPERLQLLEQIRALGTPGRENLFYLMLQGNVEMELGRLSEAADTFRLLLDQVPNDAAVMAKLLEVRYLRDGRTFDAESQAMAERILEIDPRNVRTLGLLGVHSFESGDYSRAVGYWQQLLPLVGPFTENGRMISQGIERARQLLAQQGGGDMPESSVGTRVEVEVILGKAIDVDGAAPVFIYARAAGGARMPLAVQRLTVADLPARITLDDTMAMAPGMNLSSAERVEVVARISTRGIANRGSGDIEGVFGPVSIEDLETPVSVVIDQVLP